MTSVVEKIMTVRGGDSDYFQAQNTKVEILRKQLDSNQINEKLVAMKKIVAMISKGRDVEELFPYVVKNVVCKQLEVKKLVYMYLIHYAERCQDEALLSINNFQKDLSDKNQFIRALALRVMSSIRVGLIAQIIVMSIKKCAGDLSPYVRKAACIAIPKAYSLDPELKEELTGVIEKLLADNNTMVLGAAVFAFNEVCPNNWDIIHPHYRKLCKYLVDCEEWGQVIILGTLLRYGRTQFLSPFNESAYRKQQFYSDDEDEEMEDDPFKKKKESNPTDYDLAADHRLLLTSASPLLRTNNAAVILAVASLFFHLAPEIESVKVVRPLLRLIRSNRENQYIVLANIATMTKERPHLFSNNLKDFYVFASDPIYIKDLKLEILSLLASEATVHQILKEFRSYLKFAEKDFVAATVKAMGRIASELPEITEACIHDLMALVTSNDEKVVAEAVVVIRHLIQKNPEEFGKLIKQMCLLLEDITVPVARASIVWMTGEYYDLVSDIAADSLRILAKNFSDEHDLVKLQALSLGTKLYLKEGESVNMLFQYVLNLARFDLNYDIRDRARLIRTILFNPKGNCGTLTERASEIFLTKKPVSQISSSFHERSRFAIGSLSHIVNHTVFGYEPLPEFPEKAPDSSVRNVLEDILPANTTQVDKLTAEDLFSGDIDTFYTDEEEEEEEEEDSELAGSDDNFYSEEEEDEEEEDEEEEGEEEEDEEEEGEEGEEEEEEDEEDGSEYSGEEEEEEDEEEEEEEEEVPVKNQHPSKKPALKNTQSNQLLDFFD